MNLPLVRPNFANLAIALREHFGGSILTQVLLEEARRKGIKKVIFDGARHPAEIDFLKKMPGFKCIYVTASAKTRYIRAKKRGEKSNEKSMSFADFKKEGRLATEAEFGKMSRGAIKIVNEDGIRDLHKQISDKLNKYL
jgi:dephospho-CoA kinase